MNKLASESAAQIQEGACKRKKLEQQDAEQHKCSEMGLHAQLALGPRTPARQFGFPGLVLTTLRSPNGMPIELPTLDPDPICLYA